MTLSKLQEVKLLLSTTKFDIMGITETKFTGKIKDEELDIEGYKFVRKDRKKEDGGGGCMLYYQESLDVTENIKLFPAELDTLEAIWVEFKLHSQRLLLSVMYRSQKYVDFYETLDKQLEYIWEKRKNIHIIGDLNSDLLLKGKSEEETTYGRKLLKVLRNYGLVNVIKQPTRVTASTKSLRDLSIVSEKEKVLKSRGVFETGIAGHGLNYSIIRLSKTRCPPVTKEIIDWKKCNVRNFKEEIGLVPWHSCQVFGDVDDNYWMIEKLYEQIKTEQLPKRKAKIRTKSLP